MRVCACVVQTFKLSQMGALFSISLCCKDRRFMVHHLPCLLILTLVFSRKPVRHRDFYYLLFKLLCCELNAEALSYCAIQS